MAGGIAKLCSSLEGCIQKRRTTSPEKQTTAVKAVQTVPETARKAAKTSFESAHCYITNVRQVDKVDYSC